MQQYCSPKRSAMLRHHGSILCPSSSLARFRESIRIRNAIALGLAPSSPGSRNAWRARGSRCAPFTQHFMMSGSVAIPSVARVLT